MLLYHPVEDSNHCCYRLLRLLHAIDADAVSVATLMICDFYSLFPGQLKYIDGWPRRNSRLWKTIQNIPNEYEKILNPQRVFFQLNSIQRASLSHLHSKNIIEISDSDGHMVSLNRNAVPLRLLKVIETDVVTSSAWFLGIAKSLCRIDLSGGNGLKSKTGLMEFVYD